MSRNEDRTLPRRTIVFANYSQENEEKVLHFIRALSEAGLTTCQSVHSSNSSGYYYIDALKSAFSSSSAFFVFISKDSADSKWLREEVATIKSCKNNHAQLFAITLGNAEIPDWLVGFTQISTRTAFNTAVKQLLSRNTGFER